MSTNLVKNVVIFGVDNTSLSILMIKKKQHNFLILGEGLTEGFNDSVGSVKNYLLFTLVKQRQNFTKDEQSGISLNSTLYEFSVDHSSIKNEDMVNIHQYLMAKNNIK